MAELTVRIESNTIRDDFTLNPFHVCTLHLLFLITDVSHLHHYILSRFLSLLLTKKIIFRALKELLFFTHFIYTNIQTWRNRIYVGDQLSPTADVFIQTLKCLIHEYNITLVLYAASKDQIFNFNK